MSFEEFYEIYFPFVYRSTLSYLYDKELVEDVVQEVFTAAFVSFHKLQHHEKVKGWLVLTIRNQSTKAARKALHKENSLLIWEDDMGLLEILPSDFPEEYRTVLIDRYEKRYPVPMIALKYHISTNAVYIRLTRARTKLKEFLVKEKEPPSGIYQQKGGEPHEKGT